MFVAFIIILILLLSLTAFILFRKKINLQIRLFLTLILSLIIITLVNIVPVKEHYLYKKIEILKENNYVLIIDSNNVYLFNNKYDCNNINKPSDIIIIEELNIYGSKIYNKIEYIKNDTVHEGVQIK